MKNKKISLLGPQFTYSDLATKSREFLDFFDDAIPQKIFFTSIRNVIEAIKKKKIDYALVPIENSTYGTVRETEDALLVCPKTEAQHVRKIVVQLEGWRLKKYL